uniref:Uncharacterized protein n=1 Tax=Cacopsylla melanoneura TaxID=428564 RepID=A0A8D9ED36_9HEMI
MLGLMILIEMIECLKPTSTFMMICQNTEVMEVPMKVIVLIINDRREAVMTQTVLINIFLIVMMPTQSTNTMIPLIILPTTSHQAWTHLTNIIPSTLTMATADSTPTPSINHRTILTLIMIITIRNTNPIVTQ